MTAPHPDEDELTPDELTPDMADELRDSLRDEDDPDELPDPEPDPDEDDPADETPADETPADEDETPADEDDELVRALRKEAGDYRRKLRDVETERDELRHELYRERVAALGVLADPDDLPYDEDALTDPDRLRELADELVARKPHLRSRRIRQRAGQGEGSAGDGFSLAGALARGA